MQQIPRDQPRAHRVFVWKIKATCTANWLDFISPDLDGRFTIKQIHIAAIPGKFREYEIDTRHIFVDYMG